MSFDLVGIAVGSFCGVVLGALMTFYLLAAMHNREQRRQSEEVD